MGTYFVRVNEKQILVADGLFKVVADSPEGAKAKVEAIFDDMEHPDHVEAFRITDPDEVADVFRDFEIEKAEDGDEDMVIE